MNITNVLKDHGIGIGGVDEFKEFKLLKDMAQPGDRTYFSSYGDFDDNVNLVIHNTGKDAVEVLRMNIVTENSYTTVNTYPNMYTAGSKPSFSKNYCFTTLYGTSVTKDGYLYIFRRDGTLLHRVVWGDVYNKEVYVLEDVVTGNIALRVGYDMVVYDKNLNIIKDKFYMNSTGRPLFIAGTTFYNGYIYSINDKRSVVIYDYQTDSVVKNLFTSNYTNYLICNGSKNRIFVPGNNAIYDLNFNLILKVNGHCDFSSDSGRMYSVIKRSVPNGIDFLINNSGFGIGYNLTDSNLKTRILTETSQLNDYGWYYANSDGKTLLYMTNGWIYVYVR